MRASGSALRGLAPWVVLLVLACLASSPAASKFAGNAAARLSQEHRQFLDQMWQPELALSDHLLRHGMKHDVDGRNWARLAHKLSRPGSRVKVVAFGGSVTVGYRLSNTSYPEQFVVWLRSAFPGVQFELINAARRATAATFAALCLVQELPADADLVLVEYSVNGYGGQCQCFTSPQTAGYETLLRKIIHRAPHAALMSFAAFMWLDKDNKPGKFYETGEDQHGVVARRYGVPMMSVRDALYDSMFDGANPHGIDRSKILVDIVHVGDYGAAVYAAFLAWAARQQATRALLHHRGIVAEAARAPLHMPPPLNPEAAQEAWPTFCADGAALKKYVVANEGWSFVDEGSNQCAGCHKFGFRTEGAGKALSLRVNSAVLGEGDSKDAKVMLAVSYLRSYSDVGKARLECVSGCRCGSKVLDAKNVRPTSELHTERMEVGPHPECVIRLTILSETSTRGHKFRLSSVAVHKADKIMSFSYAPVYDH